MKKTQDAISFKSQARVAGEEWVWFTAMGLTVGVAMIAALLTLIGARGLKVFWPERAVILNVQTAGAEVQPLAGIITKKQEKAGHVEEDEHLTEWQIYLGNKDVYGLSYRFINTADIASVEYPDELMRIERTEYGDAIGFPVAFKTTQGELLPAQDAKFKSSLKDAVHLAEKNRSKIKDLEKNKIGKINHFIEKNKLRLKVLERQQKDQSAEADAVRRKLEQLYAEYTVLAEQAAAMRQQTAGAVLTYQVVSGAERQIPVEKIIDFYFPNQLNTLERVQRFFHRIFVFLSQEPREANTEGGVFPAIFGTFVMTVMMSVFVTPFGVLAAIYLREYAKQGFLVRTVRIAVNNLAGVPSIVFGVFGVGFFVYFVGGGIDHFFYADKLPTPTYGTGGILWASLTLALMTVPVVIVATEESLASVPNGMREGSLACGASKWQTIQRVVLPAAAPGILTGLILAMARGASEVAPLMLVGVVKLAPSLPIDNIFPFVHFDRKFMHLGFHIYDLGFQSPDSEAAKPMVFATTLLLIGLVVMLNMSAIWIRERLRRKYVVGAF